jgi:hypothetical protein
MAGLRGLSIALPYPVARATLAGAFALTAIQEEPTDYLPAIAEDRSHCGLRQ